MMFPILQLLAQTPYERRLTGLRGAFRDREADPADLRGAASLLLMLVALVVLILVIRRIRRRKAGKTAPRHPLNLYNHVLKQMGVGLTDRWLMRLIARSTYMQQPTILFFSRELFDQHVKRWVDALTIRTFQSHARSRIETIAALAFPEESACVPPL